MPTILTEIDSAAMLASVYEDLRRLLVMHSAEWHGYTKIFARFRSEKEGRGLFRVRCVAKLYRDDVGG